MHTLSVQTADFDHRVEYEALRLSHNIGAIVCFCGLARDFSTEHEPLYLTHYPAMTEKVLTQLQAQATERWPIDASRIVHRVGELAPGEQIVFVGVASRHRKAAFEACEFLIDQLKTAAPFWKKEGEHWVEAAKEDEERAAAWLGS